MRNVVGVAGMPGAGKAIVREVVQKMGYPVMIMGDVIREEAKRMNLDPTAENLSQIMLKLREEDGPEAVAKRCISKIMETREKLIVIDGVRSLDEVNEFKRHFPNFTLIAIHSSPRTRHQRLIQRERVDDPKTCRSFVERDLRELSVGLGDVIATADHMIVNEGTKERLMGKVIKFVEGMVE